MHDGGFHRQPLRQGVFAGHHHVDVAAAAQAMVEYREQAVRIGREVHADDVGLLVDDVIEEARVPAGEAVVVLLPDVRCEQVVQRRDRLAPGELARHPQPLGMLAEHRVDDAEVALVLVQLHHVAQELAQHHRVLPLQRAG